MADEKTKLRMPSDYPVSKDIEDRRSEDYILNLPGRLERAQQRHRGEQQVRYDENLRELNREIKRYESRRKLRHSKRD
jgi:hypothetical protein